LGGAASLHNRIYVEVGRIPSMWWK